MIRHLVARAGFDVRPRSKVSQQLDASESVKAGMLHCLQGDVTGGDDGDMLPFSGGLETPVATKASCAKHTEQHKAMWSLLLYRKVALTPMLATMISSFFGEAWIVPHACSLFAFVQDVFALRGMLFRTSTPLQ